MKIEAGIPIPPRTYQRRPRTETGEEALSIQVGESRLFDEYDKAEVFRRRLYELGHKALRRKSKEGWRVWRTA